ncbi:unnamed protein product [Lymnaea stagnalis]|uniref:EF-hand domain-containing protein n=1 Tax=Lymnaea stagnalis TaxID=6523 RepID=A0AAV2IDC3_LYMST
MKNMHVIFVFLLLVPTLILSELKDRSRLVHYEKPIPMFQDTDANLYDILQPEKLTTSFDVLQPKPGDSDMTRISFDDPIGNDGSGDDAAGTWLDENDSDENDSDENDSDENDSDENGYLDLKQHLDTDRDGRIRVMEPIGFFNLFFTNPGT